MNSLANYLNHAELALAAYADLSPSMSKFQYEEALKQNGKGMSATQAADFASRWHVLEQSPDTPDGFSAVLLQQVDGNGVPVGEKVLAIRGTDGRQFKILISVEPQPAVSCHATAIVHGRPTTSQGAAHGNQPSAVPAGPFDAGVHGTLRDGGEVSAGALPGALA